MTKTYLKKYRPGWPFLLGPAAMVLVYAAYFLGVERTAFRHMNEMLALVLLSIPLTSFLAAAIRYKSHFHFFMAALSGAFFCREWHFYGTGNGIYVALVVLGVWGYTQKDTFFKTIGNGPYKMWLFATFGTYLLSQLIARRVFRFLPYEDPLHIGLEETVETTAHLMLIVAGLAGWKVRPPSTESE
jgi:hypothetical protein